MYPTPVNLRVMKPLEEMLILVLEAVEPKERLGGFPCLTILSIDIDEDDIGT